MRDNGSSKTNRRAVHGLTPENDTQASKGQQRKRRNDLLKLEPFPQHKPAMRERCWLIEGENGNGGENRKPCS